MLINKSGVEKLIENSFNFVILHCKNKLKKYNNEELINDYLEDYKDSIEEDIRKVIFNKTSDHKNTLDIVNKYYDLISQKMIPDIEQLVEKFYLYESPQYRKLLNNFYSDLIFAIKQRKKQLENLEEYNNSLSMKEIKFINLELKQLEYFEFYIFFLFIDQHVNLTSLIPNKDLNYKLLDDKILYLLDINSDEESIINANIFPLCISDFLNKFQKEKTKILNDIDRDDLAVFSQESINIVSLHNIVINNQTFTTLNEKYSLESDYLQIDIKNLAQNIEIGEELYDSIDYIIKILSSTLKIIDLNIKNMNQSNPNNFITNMEIDNEYLASIIDFVENSIIFEDKRHDFLNLDNLKNIFSDYKALVKKQEEFEKRALVNSVPQNTLYKVDEEKSSSQDQAMNAVFLAHRSKKQRDLHKLYHSQAKKTPQQKLKINQSKASLSFSKESISTSTTDSNSELTDSLLKGPKQNNTNNSQEEKKPFEQRRSSDSFVDKVLSNSSPVVIRSRLAYSEGHEYLQNKKNLKNKAQPADLKPFSANLSFNKMTIPTIPTQSTINKNGTKSYFAVINGIKHPMLGDPAKTFYDSLQLEQEGHYLGIINASFVQNVSKPTQDRGCNIR